MQDEITDSVVAWLRAEPDMLVVKLIQALLGVLEVQSHAGNHGLDQCACRGFSCVVGHRSTPLRVSHGADPVPAATEGMVALCRLGNQRPSASSLTNSVLSMGHPQVGRSTGLN